MDSNRDRPDARAPTADLQLESNPDAASSDPNDVSGVEDDPRRATTISPPTNPPGIHRLTHLLSDSDSYAAGGQPTPAPLPPGTMVGHHKLVRELGRGGMGAVYLAHDTRLDRRVAIKFLLDSDPSHVRRFQAEARATARCKHDNIIDIYEVGEAQGRAYMVLEYIKGMTLRTWIEETWANPNPDETSPAPAGTRVSPARAAEMMVPVVDALAHAHERGLIHRDLKPANIMLTEKGAIRVLDFGIAKVLADRVMSFTSQNAPRDSWEAIKTMRGAILGTMPYMSPEQWAGKDLDGRSDVWAAGIILWELVTGYHPLAPLSVDQLLSVATLDIPMPRMSERYPELRPIAGLIDGCLRKHRVERVPSAVALLQELKRLASPDVTPSSAEPLSGPQSGSQLDNRESRSSRSQPTVDLGSPEESDSATPAEQSPAASKRASARRWQLAVAILVAVVALVVVGWQVSRSGELVRDTASTTTRAEEPRSVNRPALWSADSGLGSEAVVALVGVGAVDRDDSPAAALCMRLRAHPHAAGLLPHTQDSRGLIWCRAAMSLAQVKRATESVATPVLVAVHDDDRVQLSVRGPRGSWLIDGLVLFAGTDAARAQLAPVLYGLARAQRGQAAAAGCVGPLLSSSAIDPLAVLGLYVDRQQPKCRRQATSAITPATLLAVCAADGQEPGRSEVCDLARLLYTELYPLADDAVSVVRALLDKRPELVAVAGAALARANCRLDRLATANAVLSDLVARLGKGAERACERLALADVAACIAGHSGAAEQLGNPNAWRGAIDQLDDMMAGDCAACDIPAYCGQKLGARGMIHSRRGHWDRAAADFARAFAHTHNSEWALMRAEASLHLGDLDDARRRLRQLADQRALKAPVEHLQHALFSWLAERGPHRAKPEASSLVAVHAQRLVDIYEHCCTEGKCGLEPEDAPLRALVCESPDSCIYDVLAGPRTRTSVGTLGQLLDIDGTRAEALSNEERAALQRACAAADR